MGVTSRARLIMASYFLLSAGAPPLAVAAGIGGVAMFMRRRSRTT